MKKPYEWHRAYRARLKAAVIGFYSGGTMRCAKCDFANINALVIDHIAHDGAFHRRQLTGHRRGNGFGVYADLRVHGFPPGYQVLCHNCNWLKEVARRRGE